MSTSLPSQERDTEHEILTYLRVAGSINKSLSNRNAGKMKLQVDTPLTKALDALSSIPSVQLSIPSDAYDYEENIITIGGVDAGTLSRPKVDVILEKSAPSSFGRGAETVLDPTYRSGREISAADIELKGEDGIIEQYLLATLGRVMFPGRKVKLTLYKLAVYEPGGHFDWHMDSTHSDEHHATLLVALNTSWKGGNLVLRRNGVETPVNLHPKSAYDEDDDGDDDHDDGVNNKALATVAFFTDTEHRVEPVTAGIRIVLQYDMEVAKEKAQDEKKEDQSREEEDLDEDDEYDKNHEPWLYDVSGRYSERVDMKGDVQATADKTAVDRVLEIIKELSSNGTEEVAFALQHLYRKTSILPEHLKGPDAVVYEALLSSGNYDISLHPVILREEGEYDGEMKDRYAIIYPTSGEVDTEPQRKRRKLSESKPEAPSLFHIPKSSAVEEISRQEYIEHTGNEAMPSDDRYFGGGMFVRPKPSIEPKCTQAEPKNEFGGCRQ